MNGFCLGCPVPEFLAELDSGVLSLPEDGLLRDEKVRTHLTGLVVAVADKGTCSGVKFEPVEGSDTDTFVSCEHESWDTFLDLVNALSDPADPDLDIVGKMIRKEA